MGKREIDVDNVSERLGINVCGKEMSDDSAFMYIESFVCKNFSIQCKYTHTCPQ